MNRRAIIIATAALIVIVGGIAILVSSRERIAHQSYLRAGKSLAAKLDPALKNKYAGELRYTLDKFWEFYDKDLISQNDLNDVMDKMRSLRAKKKLTETEIFDFLTYVSTLYTEAMHRRQSEMFPE